MKHIGEFDSVDGRAWRIEIETEGTGSKELKLSGTPFTASVSGDEKHLYSPIRCGGATVGLRTDSYEPSFYSGKARGVKVTLYEGNRLEWTGYVAPTMYDQDYDRETEELELDCVDGVAVLKDIPFRAPEPRQIKTMLELITYCLRESGCLSAFYISGNVQADSWRDESVIERFRISESNFFDQRKDTAQTDDDVAWSCYDVLYHIMQWLGYTLIVEGDEAFMIDYDAIRNGDNSYFRYPLEGTATPSATKVTKNYSYEIKENSYSATGTKLGLAEVYNKVTVKDEFNTYDNIFPTFGDIAYEKNITAYIADEQRSTVEYLERGPHGTFPARYIRDTSETTEDTRYLYAMSADWTSEAYVTLWQFWESPVFTFHKYSKNTSRSEVPENISDAGISLVDLNLYNGAFYCRFWKLDFGSVSDYLKAAEKAGTHGSDDKEKEEWLARLIGYSANPSNVCMSPMIVMMNQGDYRFGPGDGSHYNAITNADETLSFPYITLKDATSSAIFGGEGHFLRIKGTFRFHDEWRTPFPLNGNGKKLSKHGDYKGTDQGYIWCKVKWGEWYWNGDAWQSYDCWFPLYFWNDADCSSKGMVNEKNYDADFNFLPGRITALSLGEDGYCIPCPSYTNLEGSPELSFTTRDMHGRSKNGQWDPKGTKTDNRYCRYLCNCVFITNLSVTAEISSGFLDQADLDSDTCYTNVIDEGNVTKFPEISFRVCTEDGKKANYSCVAYTTGTVSSYVKCTCNKALMKAEASTSGFDGEEGKLRQEEHYVFKLASQYEEPRVYLEVNLHNDRHLLLGTYKAASVGDMTFVMTDRQTDYRMNSCNVKLLEKPKL